MNVREYIDTFINRCNEIIECTEQICGEYYSKFLKSKNIIDGKLDNTDEICIEIFKDKLILSDCVWGGGYGCHVPLEWFESDNYEEVIKRDYNQWLDKNKDKLENEKQKKLEAKKKKRDKEYAEYLKLKKKFEEN